MRDALVAVGEAADGVHLVFHQGDQGRDDDGRSLQEEGRKLVAERLAAAGGHQHKNIVPGKQGLDDSLLVALERLKAEKVLELQMQFFRCDRHADCFDLTKLSNFIYICNSKCETIGYE